MFQGRLVNLSCSSVPSFVVSITSTTQVQITKCLYLFKVQVTKGGGREEMLMLTSMWRENV